MKIRWEIKDGYGQASRPQYTEIPDDEIAECLDQQDLEFLINDYIAEDFSYRISWALTSDYPSLTELKK